MKKLYLYIIPILYLLTVTYASNNRGAFWLNNNVDPAYIWYNNSYSLAIGQKINHTDNPGTTVAISGAFVFRTAYETRYFFNITKEQITKDIPANKELYLNILQYFYTMLIGLSLLIIGIKLSKEVNIITALLIQSTPFLYGTLLIEISTKVSPEPLLFLSGIILLYLWILDANNKLFGFKITLIYGLIVGFGMATKFIFLPLAFLPFFLLKNNRNRFFFFFFLFFSFILFTLPIAHLYIKMIKWYYSIAIHSERYGSGKVDVFNIKQLMENIIYIFQNHLFLLLLTLISLFILVIKFFKEKDKFSIIKENKQLLIFLFHAGISILMVAKHYFANRYLIPAFMLSSGAIYFIFSELQKVNLKYKNFYFSILYTIGLITSLQVFYSETQHQKYCQKESLRMLDILKKEEYNSYAKIYYDRHSTNNTDSTYFYYNVRTKEYLKENGIYTTKENIFQQFNNKVIFYGTPFDKGYKNFPQDQGYKRYQKYYPDSVFLIDKFNGLNETFYVASIKFSL